MSASHYEIVLAGNYLTSLVAACELAQAGRKVCVINPLPVWGGHFTRLQVNGINFDPGAVSHEFTAFNDEGAINAISYDSTKRSDVGRFIRLIEKFTRSQYDVVRMPEPCTVYGGELFRDVIMGNRFETLKHPTLAKRVHSEQEAIAAAPVSELHPRFKKTSEIFIRKSYYDISVVNHGATAHAALFEPMFFKMSNLSTTRLLALYHRIAWLPLYYPETIRSQFHPNPQELQDTFFCYPKAGYIGAFGENLVSRFEKLGGTILREPILSVKDDPSGFTFSLKSGSTVTGPKAIWSLAHDSLVEAASGSRNTFERWSATLLFTTVPRSRLRKTFSVLYVPDDRTLMYRACNQSEASQSSEETARIVIEVNPDYAKAHGYSADDQVISKVRSDLVSLGIIDDPGDLRIEGIRTLANVLLLPSRENWALLEKERDILRSRYPRMIFTRNVESFFTDTLNDQIIKGMKLAEQHKSA